MVLETPKLVRSLFMTIPKSVPNFIIFPCSLHRAAIDSHGTNIIINSCKQRFRGQARKRTVGRHRAGIIEWQKQSLHRNTDRFRSSKMNRSSDENLQTHVSDSRRTRTEDLMSGTKAKVNCIKVIHTGF